jgi:5'-3' exonuclease
MLLVDMNQLVISSLMVRIKLAKNSPLDVSKVRYSVVRTLAKIHRTYGNQYGEMVLCYDSKHYWRKTVFPYYKQNRKKEREVSGYDWDQIFTVLNVIRDELRESLPFKVIQVEGAESDDIIAVLCKERQRDEDILILSADKDFIQLQKYPWVKQYDLIHKKWITDVNPEQFLREHIIRGDRSDGIPNILTCDDVFVTGRSQKTISKEKIERLSKLPPDQFNNYVRLRNWKRNLHLIDFDYIPDRVATDIIMAFCNQKPRNDFDINYFIRNNMSELLDRF